MKDKINEEFLCVLKKNILTNQIEIDYVKIERLLGNVIDNFLSFCDNPKTTLKQIIDYIKNSSELKQLSNDYRYCIDLDGRYQAFTADHEVLMKVIQFEHDLIESNKENNPEKYDALKATKEYKQVIKRKYNLWHKAYCISKTYRVCREDDNILTFSHRIDGWSNPVYQLTENFSLEIKTNFGFGSVSYFYTKLKYKNIEITPFSEWINYEFAKFSEIVRYSKSHRLKNECWLDAMEFSEEACNLSIKDEVKFVEKYIIDECEEMVSGLENLLTQEKFLFSSRQNNKYYVDKEGHSLIEFRGEKISGALDFISKIIELKKIVLIESFISRIEKCNDIIQPILANEAKIIEAKIDSLSNKRNELKPEYDKIVEENDVYTKRKAELKKQMYNDGQLNVQSINTEKLNDEFNRIYPNFKEFEEEYKTITMNFRILNEQIQNHKKVYNNIITYNTKIVNYFEK